MEAQLVYHAFGPVYDENSRILILGSFPSVKSRQQQFYYGHPQNRFWKVLAALTGREVPENTQQKRCLLLEEHIALWDVIASCRIEGSSDSSIRDVTVNDIAGLLAGTRMEHIFVNGDKAGQLYRRYCLGKTGMEAVQLPSTSPANAAWSLERLIGAWRVILPDRGV